jgi:hypothetical protein
MFDSIKPWINVPYTIRPFVKRTGTGDKQFGDSIATLCYPQGDNVLITNNAGAEITSSTQLYIEGSTQIKVTDNVIFEGVERPIQHIATYYDGKGKPDIRVVYL